MEREDFSDNLYRLVSAERYKTISEVLTQLTVPYAIIKGEPLSYAAYGKFGKRHSGDVDLLVSSKNREKVRKAFEDNGFHAREQPRENEILTRLYSHQLLPMEKASKYEHVCIDINYDIFWGEYSGKRTDIDQFMMDNFEMTIYGYTVKVLSPIKAMIQLILHHYKEMNSIFHLMTHNSINKRMFDDVYFFLYRFCDIIKPDVLLEACKKYEIIPYAYYILYYTGRIYPNTLVDRYTTLLYSKEGESLLNRFGLSPIEYGEWKISFEEKLKIDDLSPFLKEQLSKQSIEKLNKNKEIYL